MVYVTGDTHGDFSRFTSPAAKKLKKDDILVVLGDFGFFWNGDKKEKQALRRMAKLKYTILFLDGPHENYELLDEFPEEEAFGGRVQRVDERIYHLLRGEIYTLEEETFFTFGGGQPPALAEPAGRWDRALPTAEEIRHARHRLEEHGNAVDFVLTHEPSGKIGGYLNHKDFFKDNIFLNSVEDTVTYREWLFGSTHMDKSISKRHRAVFQAIVPMREATRKKRR